MDYPEAQAEGSLGTGVPRDDKKKSVPREDIPKPRPERSEGCLGFRSAGQKMSCSEGQVGVEIGRTLFVPTFL
jgi:hypothetical protein